MSKQIFFSIIIPAHNEEKYIEQTLEHLESLEYPKDSFEVIVVENGSEDTTFETAQKAIGDNGKVIRTPEKGVSAARNLGTTHSHEKTDWLLFLDADTHIRPSFLRDISEFIEKNEDKGYVAGSATLWPWPKSWIMYFLYIFSNLGFYLRNQPYEGLLFVKREVLKKGVKFDTDIHVGEGMRLAAAARSEGNLFFVWTPKAYTSTRRFTQGGLYKIPVWVGMWLFAMIVPIHVQRRFKYKSIR